ncbi:MAG: response regulator transcription factor, partial [Actinobacteria bacterium]|nr:response regulator transcription factor [Actinomycetota bacterium]
MKEPSKPRVFLVEDHPLTLFGLQRYLEDRFDVVGSAIEAASAIEMILERRPDLVLLDVHFPGGGGAAVIEAVKRKDQEIKFLAFTVSTSADDVVRLFKAGVDGYVVKTTDGSALAEQILLA